MRDIITNQLTEKRLRVTYCILFLFVCIYALISLYKLIITTTPDFSIYYQSALDLLNKHNPYTDKHLFTTFNYPPITVLPFMLLLIFPYKIAQAIFVISNIFALSAVICLSLKIIFQKVRWQYFMVFFSLAFLLFPVKFTIGMGQSNLVALVFLLWGFQNYKEKKIILSGLLTITAIILKPILVFALLFYLIKKQWQLLLGIMAMGIIVTLASLAVVDLNNYLYYFQKVVPHLMTTTGREVYYNQGLMGFVSRLIWDLKLRSLLSWVGDIVVILTTIVFSYKNKSDNYVFSLILTTLVIVDTLSWQHHFVFLIFPFIYMTFKIYQGHIKLRNLAVILLTISYLLVSWNIKNPGLFRVFPVSLLLSHVFFGTTILYFLLLLA